MLSKKFEKVWKIMSDYTFEMVDCCSDNVVCNLCNELMIDPYATECNCQFCGKCIKNFLKNDLKCCPGQKESCKYVSLVMEENVVKDYVTRQKISNIIVKCPNIPCLYTAQLGNIKKHIHACQQNNPQQMDYKTEEFNGNNCKNSLHKRTENQDRKLNKIKKDVIALKELIKELKKDEGNRNDEIESRKADIIVLKEEVVASGIKIENQILEINELKENGKIIKNELEKLILNKERNEALFGEIIEEINCIKKMTLNCCNVKSECLSENIDGDLKHEQIKNEVNKSLMPLKLTLDKVISFILNQSYTFVWTVTDISQKVGWYNSESFYKDKYKFCLRIMIGQCFLRSHICIMRGQYDDDVSWPMASTVLLTIINKDTLEEYVSKTCNHETYNGEREGFCKPYEAFNNDISGPCLPLRDNYVRSLSQDSVTIFCSIIPPS